MKAIKFENNLENDARFFPFSFVHQFQVNVTPVKLDLYVWHLEEKHAKNPNERREKNKCIECNFLK